ncbi:MAG: PEP/pyruvate-binding domain-containing protein, partial [Gammaproteobacteria bacterium]
MHNKLIYLFHEGNAGLRDLLGGKGANLAEMTNIGLPVPPGFTITTEVCRESYRNGGQLPAGLMDEVATALAEIESKTEKNFGGITNPLLVSVRSGAKFSMPGMMDTILNLGLNDETIKGLVAATGDERFAYDAYRRFIMMFSNVVMEVPKRKYEQVFRALKKNLGAEKDADVSAPDLKTLCEEFKTLTKVQTGHDFPQNVRAQLETAIEAVCRSWNTERAILYRRVEKISNNIGTAVNVQAMVFGNKNDSSGTGVVFTSNPASGERILYGEYLMNAQGEDVVAGARTPADIQKLADQNPKIYQRLTDIAQQLETHYRDMQDIEFTVQE